MVIARDALDKLLDLIGGDTGSLAELIESFLDESPLLLDQLQQAAGAGDRMGLGRAAHTLKSSARDFGAVQLSSSCEMLEKECREGMPERAAAKVETIFAECTLARNELTACLAELRKGA
jgi:HPt (histidine-containing phosphotransfer) domain-containing protein